MRLALIVNASASAVTPRVHSAVEATLATNHELSTLTTARRGHATDLARAALDAGADAVAVLGGDGTLNEAANALAGTTTPLAVLPGGSTNVFARTIGVKSSAKAAADALVDDLAAGSTRDIGLGSVNGRYFVSNVGMGFDAAVVARVERHARIKRVASHPLFIACAFATWFRHYDRSRVRFSLQGGESPPVDAVFAIVLNADPYTYLGRRPLHVVGGAHVDGGLSAVAVWSLGFGETLWLAAGALGVGRAVPDHHQVTAWRDLPCIDVTGIGPFPYQVDGDHLGDADRLTFRHHPNALRVVVPPRAS